MPRTARVLLGAALVVGGLFGSAAPSQAGPCDGKLYETCTEVRQKLEQVVCELTGRCL